MMLGALYLIISAIAAGLCTLNAWEEQVHFYPVAVYLSTNKTAVLIMGNFGFAMALVFVKTFQTLFFGRVTDEESREITEKSKYAILETCLALTTFRLSLNVTVVCLFTVLLFSKMFHWLASMRVDNSERQRLPLTTLLRIGLPLAFLFWTDAAFILGLSYISMQSGKVDVLVLFSFEWTILIASILYHSFRFILATVEHVIAGQMRAKHMLLFLAEFCHSLVRLALYVSFFVVVMVELGSIPLHLLREMFMNIVFLWGMLVRFYQYRKIMQNLERFPTVNLAPEDERDSTCTVCMAEITEGKELPCGHIFHLRCLKEWLRRNPICPTCRHPIRVPPQPAPAANANNPAPAANAAPNVPPAADAAQPQQQAGANQARRGRNVIILPVVQGGQQRQAAGQAANAQPVTTSQSEGRVQSTSFRFVLPSPLSDPGQGLKALEKYTLNVQREAEVHEMYLGHLYSLQHHLLKMQQRWKAEEKEQEIQEQKSSEGGKDKEEKKGDEKENEIKLNPPAEAAKSKDSSGTTMISKTSSIPATHEPKNQAEGKSASREPTKKASIDLSMLARELRVKETKETVNTVNQPVVAPSEPVPIEMKKAHDRARTTREMRLQKFMLATKPKTPNDEDSGVKKDE